MLSCSRDRVQGLKFVRDRDTIIDIVLSVLKEKSYRPTLSQAFEKSYLLLRMAVKYFKTVSAVHVLNLGDTGR